MAKNTTIYYTKEGRSETAVTVGSSTKVLAFTAGTEGTKILRLFTVSGATTTFKVWVYDGSTYHELLSITNPTADMDLLTTYKFPLNANGSPGFNLHSGETIWISSSAAIVTVTTAIYGEDY